MAEQKRKKILYLTNRVPYPPDKGDRIRTFHQIDRLALRHDVYCATFTETPADAHRVARLRRWCRDVLAIPWQKSAAILRAARSWSSGGTLTHGAYHHPVMARQLARWSERQRFDVVVCFSSIMAPYVEFVSARRKVLDLCDVDSEKWSDYARTARFPMSRLYASEARRLAGYEHSALNEFDETIVITRRERLLLDAFEQNPRIHVVPNGVQRVESPSPAADCGPVIGFIGTMNYRPNVDAVQWFSNSVWPLVRERHPEAQFNIIGRSPTRAIRRLGRRQGITVTGAVRDTRTHLDRCRIVVAPLRVARGLPNKIIEAMAAGRPVVSTSAAADCLAAEPETHLLVGDTAATFADGVSTLLTNDARCRSLADASRAWVARHHCWDSALDDFERIVAGPRSESRQSRPARAIVDVRHGVIGSTWKPPITTATTSRE